MDTLNPADLAPLSLEELFGLADEIGTKYQTDQEILAFDRAIAEIRQDIRETEEFLANFQMPD